MRAFVCFCAATLVACVSNSAFAHSDVLVRTDGGKIVIGAAEDLDAEEGGPFFDLDTNVFEGILANPAVALPPLFFDFERDEPGFFTNPSVTVGDAFPANTLMTLNPFSFSVGGGHDSVHYWDGSGAVDFQPLSAAQPGVSFEAAEDDPLETDIAGALDGHPIWGLDGGAAEGVYLVSYTISAPGLVSSDPFFMVWLADEAITGEDDAEMVEEAIEELEENGIPAIVNLGGTNIDFSFYEEAVEFADAIPEPSTGLLLMTVIGIGAARRR